jgi:DNA polymerase III delta subunit
MLIILHGENQVRSRAALVEFLSPAQEKNLKIIHLDGRNTTTAQLENALAGNSLFSDERWFQIEELLSGPASQKKDQNITLVIQSAQDLQTTILLWEKKDLTAHVLKKITTGIPSTQLRIQQFPVTKSLFQWLDSLTGDQQPSAKQHMLELLQASLKSDGDFMCLAMLIRQVRLLLQAQTGTLAGPPFLQNKLRQQAKRFSPAQLKKNHQRLVKIDRDQKTSGTRLSLEQELALLVIEM